MKFAEPIWLFGLGLALLVLLVLVIQALKRDRQRARLGDLELVSQLLTAKTPLRRAFGNALIVAALACFALAAAGPQYGKGTRILPKTNLDIAIVLDYSKSMYARDVSPSRSLRAKAEVENLIRQLAGARFAGIAFAGESLAFPLTSDGAAIAQFFRGLTPHDMPVGGTAIARALQEARGLFARDRRAKNHEKVILLVTDGEDLEGNPEAVAEEARADGIRIEVVQIGGQSPEPIPDIDENGNAHGYRRDRSGQIMTTSLSPEGEAVLKNVASLTDGALVKSRDGSVGVDEMAMRLKKLMTEELTEKVETVFADVYHYPLALGLLFLLLETLFFGGNRRKIAEEAPKKEKSRKKRKLSATVTLLLTTLALCPSLLGCSDPDQFFLRESPQVNEAIEALAKQEQPQAIALLADYLETGPCEEGLIGAGDRARSRGEASLDLALALIVEPSKDSPPSPQLDCALRMLAPIASDEAHEAELRSASYYLMGNLELRKGNFAGAIENYDASLRLLPAQVRAPADAKESKAEEPTETSIPERAAYNRALAQRLKEAEPPPENENPPQEGDEDQNQDQDQQDQSEGDQDQQDQSEGDQDQQDQSEGDQDQQDQSEGDQDQQDQNEGDQDQDQQDQQDQSEGDQDQQDQSEGNQDQQDQSESKQDQQDQSESKQDQAPPPATASPEAERRDEEARNERILDMFEQAPSLEQEKAKERARRGVRRPTMEDK